MGELLHPTPAQMVIDANRATATLSLEDQRSLNELYPSLFTSILNGEPLNVALAEIIDKHPSAVSALVNLYLTR